MLNPISGHFEDFESGDDPLPHPCPLLPFRQIQVRHQLTQALKLDRVCVVVVTLDDLLLIGRVVAGHWITRCYSGYCNLRSGSRNLANTAAFAPLYFTSIVKRLTPGVSDTSTLAWSGWSAPGWPV